MYRTILNNIENNIETNGYNITEKSYKKYTSLAHSIGEYMSYEYQSVRLAKH